MKWAMKNEGIPCLSVFFLNIQVFFSSLVNIWSGAYHKLWARWLPKHGAGRGLTSQDPGLTSHKLASQTSRFGGVFCLFSSKTLAHTTTEQTFFSMCLWDTFGDRYVECMCNVRCDASWLNNIMIYISSSRAREAGRRTDTHAHIYK